MKFTEIFIRKPVLSIVTSLLLLMVGLVSYNKLSIRQFPKISASTVNITTTYPGASAELMESYVTAPIERSISGINGVDYISSNSKMDNSSVTIHFKLGHDINQAISDVRDKVNAARYKLPDQAHNPIITKQDPNVTPIIYIAFTSKNMSPENISDYLKRVIQPNFETIDGVAQANILGDQSYAMRILLNPHRMANNNVTSQDVVQALNANHLHPPAGRLESSLQEFEVTARTEASSEEEFNHLIVHNNSDHITRIKDIGQAKLSPAVSRFSVKVNSTKAVLIGIIARSDGNPLNIAKGVKNRLNKLQPQMPGDLKTTIVWDTSNFIHESIQQVQHTIIEATLFVIFIIFAFLGSFRMLSIPLITIPLSLVGICGLMLALDFSLNTMTLLAMVLAIGLVVDDSIVVAENIHRHVENGLSPLKAAIKGASEIQFAIIAMTLTLAAVFAPIGFLTGLTGALFKEFAFTLAGTVIISGFIALTLSPMLCSKMITRKALSGKMASSINKRFNKFTEYYLRALKKVLNVRMIVPILLFLSIPADVFFYQSLHKELAPKEDVGSILAIVRGPANTNLKYTEHYTDHIANILEQVPEKENMGMINGSSGVNSGMSFLTLKPWGQRRRNINEIINSINPKLWGITGVNAFAVNPYQLPGSSGFMPVSLVLQTTADYDSLLGATEKMMRVMKNNPIFLNVSSNLKIDTPKVTIDINRNLAGELGIPLRAISNTISLGLGQAAITQFSMHGKSYDVIPELASQFKEIPEDINNLYVRTISGNLVPLANLVTIKEVTQQQEHHHFDQLRSAKITAALAPGHSLEEAISFLKVQAHQKLSSDTQYSFSGETRQFLTANNTVMFTFIFALLFIILLLSAQFESFIAPFIVLCGLFFSLVGALGALYAFGYSSNIYTQIGLVTLIGLISKHGILIVEFANQLKEQGQTAFDAITESAKLRLRPILMTTAAMVLGALPLLLAHGAGANSRKQIGLVIVSGMSFGTLMTIFVVPAIYLIVEGLKQRFKHDHVNLDPATQKP